MIRSVAFFLPLFFLFACAPKKDDPEFDLPEVVTFNEHIAPIIHENCTPCHRPGETGPFSLITYKNVRKRAKMVKEVTGLRYMPPWPADRGYSNFIGERGLTKRQIALIAKWKDSGAKEGDPSIAPEPPEFASGSQLGEPDLVVPMGETFMISGDNTDRFVLGKAPYEIERDTFIRAIEFVPGNRELVHHMNGHLINYADGRKSDLFSGEFHLDAEEVYSADAYEMMELANDDGTYPPLTPSAVNYLPGLSPPIYPEGIGGYFINKKGLFLMNTLHYGPTPLDTSDLSHFNVFFANEPPERPLKELQLGTLGMTPVEPELVIPPEEIMTFTTKYTLEKDISVLTINPHMHLLGTVFWAFAIDPKGDTIPLVRIPVWDFRWQYAYTFQHMLPLMKGTTIYVKGTFDNTSDNPENPFDPPRVALAPKDRNMRTTDEMFQFFINYVDFKPGDDNISLEPPQ